MAGFMKTWSKKSAFFSTKTAARLDFRTSKRPKNHSNRRKIMIIIIIIIINGREKSAKIKSYEEREEG